MSLTAYISQFPFLHHFDRSSQHHERVSCSLQVGYSASDIFTGMLAVTYTIYYDIRIYPKDPKIRGQTP